MNPAPMDDPGQDLARWATSGDQAALERALAAAADPAYTQALRLLGRAADADDATQEALVQLTRSARRYDPSRPFRPWLARIVHDACCRLLRAGRRRRRHETQAPPPLVEPEPVDAEVVRAAVLGLPEPLRAAVELHYFAGLSQAEAAQALGIGEGACAMRLSRARERLRDLLARQGLGTVTTTAALAVLSATPTHAAPAGLAAHIAGQAAAGTLPATTIPLTTLQSGVWFMATHPISTALSAAVLAVALLVPFALDAGEATKPVAPPVAVADQLSASASALLPYLDDKAPFRALLDLESLRPRLLRAKPFSLFADERLAPSLAAGRHMLALAAGRGKDQFWLSFWLDLASDGRAISGALRDRTSGQRKEEERMLIVADVGAKADDLAAQVAARQSKTPPPPIGPFTGLFVENKVIFAGRDGNRFVACFAPWLSEQVKAPAAAAPAAPVWFRCEVANILAEYARLSGPDQDPGAVSSVIGPQWRNMRPVIEGTVDVRDNELVGAVQVSGAGPLSPATMLTLLVGGTTKLPLGGMSAWPLRTPRLGVPASADRVAAFSLGVTPPVPSPEEMERNFANLPSLIGQPDPVLREELLRIGLVSVWSGDLAMEVRPGVPLPRCAMVLGLRRGIDPAQVLDITHQIIGGTQDAAATAGQIPGAITAFTSLGQITVTAFADRLVVTWNADLADWPGIATTAAPAAASACSLQVDLPAVARTWYPLAAMALPPELRPALPPLPALLPHLPVWNMTWDATPDGCRIRERGLPLMTLMTATAAARVIVEADPALETFHGNRMLQPIPEPSPRTF